MPTKYEKSHKTDAPQQGISFPFLLDIFTKSLTLYNNSCIILMSCYFLSITLLSWCAFLQMTLIECQSPLKARGGGQIPPCRTRESLIKRLPQLFFIFATETVCLGNTLAPFKTLFPFEEGYSQTNARHSFPNLYAFTPGSDLSARSVNKHSQRKPSQPGVLWNSTRKRKKGSAFLSSWGTAELSSPLGLRMGLQNGSGAFDST